jgi:hypothetical protein
MTTNGLKTQDRSSRALGHLKSFGALILAICGLIPVWIGVLAYSNQRQQNQITDMLGFIATVDQGSGATAFRNDIQLLVLQFYDKTLYSGDVDTDLAQNPVSSAIDNLVQTKILSKYLVKFKGILAFIDQMHVYGVTSTCAWKFIWPAFQGDSNTILYYFSPVLYDANFVKQQYINPVNLENFSRGTLTDKDRKPLPSTSSCNF